MGEKKRQHLVPACYLANFGIHGNQGRDSTVYWCNTSDLNSFNKPRIASVNSFPIENYFYDIYEFEERKQILEEFFSKIEGEYSNLLRKVLKYVTEKEEKRKTSGVFSSDDKMALSGQFAMQIVRTKHFRNYYQGIYSTISDAFPKADFPKYKEADFQRLHTNELLDFNAANFYANLLSDRNWAFLINHTSIPFFTSDNPAIFIDNSFRNMFSVSPVQSEVTFYIPLSPQIAVELYDKNVLRETEVLFDIYKKENIRWYNMNLKVNGGRFIISNQSDFSCLTGSDEKNE